MSFMVELHGESCVASGQCVMAAPDVFDQSDDDGIAFVLNARPSDGLRKDVELAANLCPARAILVKD